MTFQIPYPSRTNNTEKVRAVASNPDNYIMESGRRNRYTSGMLLPEVLRFLLTPDQLEWTQQEVSNAALGIEKVIKLAMPSDDLAVLRKYRALALPTELVALGTRFTSGPGGVQINAHFKPPFDQLSDMSGFLVPLEWCRPDTRPTTELGQAFTRQIERLNAAIAGHDQRMDSRVKDYMFGRPVVTSRQRVVSNMMDMYPEFDWPEQILPYLKIKERKTAQDEDQ